MENLVPTEFYLSQNYPNPFKKMTTIKYCLPEEVSVKIEIFNGEKEKIKTLVDEIKEPGTYQVEFKPTGFEEGIYFYRLTAGSTALSKKMILTH